MLAAGRISNKWFIVYVQKNTGGAPRLGVVVSKRIMPSAVARNFTKRLIREVFRLNMPVDLAFDAVVRARRKLDSESSTEGRLALKQLLQSIQP